MSDTPPTPNHAHASGSHYQPSLPVVLLIVVLFIAATFLMVRAVSPSTASSATTTTTTLATGGTKPPAIVKSAVSVQVSNGNAGDASHYTQLLTTQNWDTLPADNGPTVKSTVIYFHPGYQAAAQLIAKTIRVSSTSVRPLGRSKPVTGYASDDVIVILGPNSRP
jgi:uncharacterized protein YggE